MRATLPSVTGRKAYAHALASEFIMHAVDVATCRVM